MYDGSDDNSLCNLISKLIGDYIGDPRLHTYAYAIMQSLLLLPINVFFAFNDPHDCFVCLGKDPDRKYSRFQLTREECARRKMVAKYSIRSNNREST